MTSSADDAPAQGAADATNLDGATLHQPDTALEPHQVEAQVTPPAGEDDHRTTAARVALLPWGEGSAPSLPSIDDGSNAGSDRDSAVASERSSTVSVSSSVYHFVEENGRTYHKYKEGRYHLPNDKEEQERLDLQHACFLVSTGGKLFLAPIGDNPRHVLDIATGTGIWAIEFAQMFPGTQVLGTDLSPIQPEFIPANCTFEIDDAEDEWRFATKFDFIHGRALLSCFDNPSYVIKQAFNALAPGGYLEYQDGCFPMEYVGDPPVHSSLYRWNQLLKESSTQLGRNWACALNYKRWFEEAGFEDVVERRFYWPNGPWAKGSYYKNIAAYAQEDLLQGVEPLSVKMFSVVGYTAEMTRAFCEEVRKDIRDPKIRAYVPVIFVWGRKPGEPAAPAASLATS